MKMKIQGPHGEFRRSPGLLTLQSLKATLWAVHYFLVTWAQTSPHLPGPLVHSGQQDTWELAAGVDIRVAQCRVSYNLGKLIGLTSCRNLRVHHPPLSFGASHWVAPGKAIYGQIPGSSGRSVHSTPQCRNQGQRGSHYYGHFRSIWPSSVSYVPFGKLKFNTFIQKIPCQTVCQEFAAKENKTK